MTTSRDFYLLFHRITPQFDEKNRKNKPVGFPDGFGFDQPYKISPWKIWQLLILINLQEFSWDFRGDKNGLENHLKKSGKIFPPKFFESVKMVKWTLEIDSWGLDQVEATSGWRWLQHILISIFPLCVMPSSMKSVKKREPFWKHIQHCFWIKITMMDLRLWIWHLWLEIKRFWNC